jgi:hypothetical protein
MAQVGMRRRGRGAMSRSDVEDAYGRNCIAALPEDRALERFTSPRGDPVLVLRNPGAAAVRNRLVAEDGYATIRFWLSPCGDRAYAWSAGDVTHFQLYGDLEDHGWHQCRIDLTDPESPIFKISDRSYATLSGGRAAPRMAGVPYLVHTELRTILPPGASDEGREAEPSPAPR